MRKKRLSAAFVATLLLASGQSAGAQDDPDDCDAAPDAVLIGDVVTMDGDNPQAEAVAVKADTIMAVGTRDEILALRRPGCGTAVSDLGSLTILPGFNDSHSHWFSWSEHICAMSGETTYPELEEIMAMVSRNGWTSFTELNFGRPDFAPAHLTNALDLSERGELSVRLNGYWGTMDDPSMIDVLADAGRTPSTFYADRVRAPGVKMYVDDPFGGSDILSQEETTALVAKAHADGWQVAAHAVNESGVEKILVAFETVLGAETNETRRHRIEHAVKVTNEQLDRMKAKGIIASFQLLGPADWPTQSDFGDRFLGSNPEWTMRWKDFVESRSGGLRTTGSTDAPFNEAPCNYSPFEMVYQAVTRDGYVDRTPADWELDQRLTTQQALELLTIDGAYATFEEDVKGSLSAGKWADYVVVSDNPLEAPTPEDLRDIEVLMTVVGGEHEYCNAEALGTACDPITTFLVDEGVVSASRYLEDQTPDLAFDGDLNTNWGAGDHPPQWIQIEFPEAITIAGIDMVVDQFPAGRTVHEVWAGDPGSELELLERFGMDTETDQVITYEAPTDIPAYRIFQVKSVLSLSWASWKEITVRRASATSVDGTNPDALALALGQNFPNPFATRTTVSFRLPPGEVGQLVVYDLFGRPVRTWKLHATHPRSDYLTWDGTDDSGNPVATGVYLYRLRAGSVDQSRLMTVLR